MKTLLRAAALVLALAVADPARSAGTKISELPAATALAGPELIAGVQSGATVKITAAQLKTLTSASPTLVTPVLGVASATSINKLAITAPASGATLTIANGKTLTANNSLTLAGADSTVMTFPGASDTVVTLAAAQTLTNKTFTAPALGAATATSMTLSSFLKVGVLTVSTLPTCNAGAEGSILGVSDALAPTFLATLSGGGLIHAIGYCNGTNWVAV